MSDLPRIEADEYEVGDEAPKLTIDDLTRKDFVKYAGASGDFNPIHWNQPYATDAGNPNVFAQGMLVAGFMSTMVTRWFGIESIYKFRTRFVEKTWPEETIVISGEILDTNTEGNIIHVEAELLAANQFGDEKIIGTAVARFRSTGSE